MFLFLKNDRNSFVALLAALAAAVLVSTSCGESQSSQGTPDAGSEALSLESISLCDTLKAALSAAKGKKAFLREAAPVLPRGYWLTESDNIQKGSFLTFENVTCTGEKASLEYNGLIKFKQGLLGAVKEQTIEFRDEE